MENKYSEEVMKHFLSPRNVGRIKNPSGLGKISNSVCGDVMEMSILVEEKTGKKVIKDAKFQTFGCGAAVATSSIVTEIIKGKAIEEAEKITPEDIDSSLGHLPAMKKHCAQLAVKALKMAIKNFQKKKDQDKEDEK